MKRFVFAFLFLACCGYDPKTVDVSPSDRKQAVVELIGDVQVGPRKCTSYYMYVHFVDRDNNGASILYMDCPPLPTTK